MGQTALDNPMELCYFCIIGLTSCLRLRKSYDKGFNLTMMQSSTNKSTLNIRSILLSCFLVSSSIFHLHIESAISQTVVFTDVTDEAGVRFRHHNGKTEKRHIIETMGSGAAFFDYNNDSFLDLYIVNSGDVPETTPDTSAGNILYRNNGDGTFADVTEFAGVGDTGYGMGVAVADYDNDGDQDIYVTNFGPNVLYRNNGDGTFTDATQEAAVGDEKWGTSCAFLDFDLDGNLDLYVVNYVEYDLSMKSCTNPKSGWVEYCHPRTFKGTADVFYQNNGDGTFTNVTKRVGVYNSAEGRGMGIAVGDVDNNGYPDLYIVNDTNRNFFYYNNGDGTFTDIALFSGTGYNGHGIAEGGMGVDFGDYNRDGWLDIFVTNTETNTLYRSHGDGDFTDETETARLGGETALLVGFGTKFFDYDNDGDLDIFVANGHVQDRVALSTTTYPQRDELYRNNGDGTYAEISDSAGKYFSEKYVGRGVAFGDYDNDGDTDVFIVNSNQRAILLRNDGGNRNYWIAIQLIGTKSNRDGIGARLRVTSGQKTQIAEVQSGASYCSASDRRVIFGLGKMADVDEIEVKWPSGIVQTLKGIRANQLVTITESR